MELMKIGEKNYIKQLRLHNEKALAYVIDEYGGLLMSVIRNISFIFLRSRKNALMMFCLKSGRI